MSRLISFRAWLVLTVLWVAFVGAYTYVNWPRVPFDISPDDPVTRAALAAAIRAHVWLAMLWAALIPAMALVLGYYLKRRNRA